MATDTAQTRGRRRAARALLVSTVATLATTVLAAGAGPAGAALLPPLDAEVTLGIDLAGVDASVDATTGVSPSGAALGVDASVDATSAISLDADAQVAADDAGVEATAHVGADVAGVGTAELGAGLDAGGLQVELGAGTSGLPPVAGTVGDPGASPAPDGALAPRRGARGPTLAPAGDPATGPERAGVHLRGTAGGAGDATTASLRASLARDRGGWSGALGRLAAVGWPTIVLALSALVLVWLFRSGCADLARRMVATRTASVPG